MQRLQLILLVLLLSFGVQPCGDSDTERQEPAILPASSKPQPWYSDGNLHVPQNDFRKGENASRNTEPVA